MLRRALLFLAIAALPALVRAEYPGHVYGGWISGYGSYIAPSIRTPPYFSVRPPVYYGDQYSRPYGMSPYPAPPMVQAPAGYQGRLESPAASCVTVNPHVESIEANDNLTGTKQAMGRPGRVQTNPFVVDAERIARR